LLGQAYVTAYATVAANRPQTERVADELIKRKEIHGDEVVELLDGVGLVRPTSTPSIERTWPRV